MLPNSVEPNLPDRCVAPTSDCPQRVAAPEDIIRETSALKGAHLAKLREIFELFIQRDPHADAHHSIDFPSMADSCARAEAALSAHFDQGFVRLQSLAAEYYGTKHDSIRTLTLRQMSLDYAELVDMSNRLLLLFSSLEAPRQLDPPSENDSETAPSVVTAIRRKSATLSETLPTDSKSDLPQPPQTPLDAVDPG